MSDDGLQPFLAWAEEQLQARVVRCERQGERRSGGRPAFYIDFEASDREASGSRRGGRTDRVISTYARMERGDGQLAGKAFGLEREHRILVALHEQGIRVPAIHGFCDAAGAPRGILMENVRGDFDYSQLAAGPERDALDRDFLGELLKVHRTPTEVWTGIGLELPRSAEGIALADLARWERTYRMALKQPVPIVEFATRWLRRNIPSAPEGLSLIQGDTGPGQFIFRGSKLAAIIDWEFAHLADPMLDLAQIRTRDFYNPGGDMTAWMRTYAELSGAPIDEAKLRYYTVKSMVITPLALAGVVQNMVPQTDHAEWYAQDVTYKRATAEALGEAIEATLEPPDVPDAADSSSAAVLDLLDQNLRDEHRPAAPDDYARYRIDLALRLSAYLRNTAAIGSALEAQEEDERAALLAASPGSEAAAEEALLSRIAAEDPKDDAALVAYLYRRSVREEALWRGGLGVGEGAVLQPVRL